MKVVVERDKPKLIKQATQELANLFNENKDRHVLFLTSGGSSFDLLTSLQVPTKHISIGVLDERYSTNSAINNFTQLKNTDFFKRSKDVFEQILDSSVHKGESLEEFAHRFESLLRNWRRRFPEGVIVATVGMGPDGHVSGIMPYPESEVLFQGIFNDPRRWVIGYDAGNKNQYHERATTTLPFMKKNIDFAIAYISGENKKDALSRVLAEEGRLNDTPARILHEMRDVAIFTDIEVSV